MFTRRAWGRIAALAVDFIQNSGRLKGAVDQIIADTIGNELKLRAKPDMSALGYDAAETNAFARMVEARWRRYAWNQAECDYRGKFALPQLLDVALRHHVAYGEALGLIEFMSPAERRRYGIASGSKLLMVTPTRLVPDTNEIEGLYSGVSHDANGRPVAYRLRHREAGIHVTRDHPTRDRAGRQLLVHAFDPWDGSDVRGVSPIAAAMRTHAHAEKLNDATLATAILQTVFAATLTSAEPSQDAFQAIEALDEDSELKEDFLGYYAAEAETDVDMMLNLPGITGNRRWVGLVAQGEEDEVIEPREIETDADTGETVLISVPKVIRRKVNIVRLPGQIELADNPVLPEVPANQCLIAYVLLSTTGIVGFVPGTQWRAKTLYEVEGRVTSLELTLSDTIQRTTTLETNLANLARQMTMIPRPEIMLQLKTDVAAMRRALKMPAAARAYWYDAGLVQDDWDKQHPQWLARVREGTRFAFAQIVDSQMSVLNPSSTDLKISYNILMPDWTEEARITVDGTGATRDISQQVHTIQHAQQHTVSYTSISYGPSFGVCENQAEWANIADKRAGETFNVNGTEYVAQGVAQGTLVNTVTGSLTDFSAHNQNPANAGHQGYAVAQVQYNTWSETYWTYWTEEIGVNGSIYGQTFLNAQPSIATSIDLKFTKVGADGEVHLFLCLCDATGAPRFDTVIASTSRPANQLVVGWNKFSFRPTLMQTGKRYAWYTVTVGNHQLQTVTNNKFAQGSLFWATDGAWAQGDPLQDFCFRLNAAKFKSTRTVIQFTALTCSLGMSEIQLLYQGWAPAGTSMTWQVKPTGDNEWHDIQGGDASPLYGLPALTELRAVFVGTTDLAPAIVMDVTARSAAMRVRGDMKAVSDPLEFGFSSTTVTMVVTLDRFDPAYATYTPQIIVGSTPVSASISTVALDPDKPGRRTVTSVFTLGSAATAARAFPQMTNTDLTNVPFIENILLAAS